MNFSSWSIRRPIPTIVTFLVLTIAGWIAFTNLGIDANPNIDIPTVSISVSQLGAGPQEMETQITKKVEDAVAGLGNIDELNSTVTDGNSFTVISFVLGTEIDRATNDVRDAITRIRQDLPQDAQEPIVRRLEFEGGPIMSYVVSSPTRSVAELSDLVDRTISREIANVKGVSQIRRRGGVDEEIRVDLDPTQLNALGITATQVNDQIRSFNVNLPGGRADIGGQEQGIRTIGSAQTVSTLENLEIVLPRGGAVPLKSLGTVKNDFAEQRQSAHLDNNPVVGFSVFRSTGSILVTVEDGVRKAVEQLESQLPDDITFQIIYTRATDIRDSYQASIEDLWLSCILAIVVVGFFLRDWRTTLISATALPLSIIPTFLVLQAFGYTLNSMTTLALTLAIGNLVDDAIVEVENAERHVAMGKTPLQAAIDSSSEVGLAVVTTAATLIAVFIPVAFMGGVPGQFFKPFGVTVSVATVFSTAVARFLTPIMSAYLLKPKPLTLENPNRPNPYQWLLNLALRHRLLTLAAALGFFVFSLMLAKYIPTSLFDAGDDGITTISVEVPPGSTLTTTQSVTQRLTNELKTNVAVQNVYAQEEVNSAEVTVLLKPKSERDISLKEFEDQSRSLLQEIPGARLNFQSRGAAGNSKAMTIVLKSENPEALNQAALELTRELRTVPGLVEVGSSASVVKPEILITPDPQRAADLGVSVSSIARTASLATLGDNESNLADFDIGDRQIPIRVRLAPEFRQDLATLENLQVPSQTNQMVPLVAVADLSFSSGPAEIQRFDRARQITVGANLQGITLGQAIEQVNQLPGLTNLPAGVTQQPSGDAEIMRDIFGRFGLALGTAVVMIYAVLVLLYNNFFYPIGVMAALPLSIGGALLGLMVAQKPLGLFALIGIVLLMGLVTKNSILLVDYALIAKERGKSIRQSVIEAGTTRLRPILMTSVSTVAGMLPIALEFGTGSETRSPMAIAVIGGFTTSTLLTLVVVPVLHTYVESFQARLGRFLGKVTGIGQSETSG
jgi:hydrophobe/amphiphile efflux-1 (HAE1) family protein